MELVEAFDGSASLFEFRCFLRWIVELLAGFIKIHHILVIPEADDSLAELLEKLLPGLLFLEFLLQFSEILLLLIICNLPNPGEYPAIDHENNYSDRPAFTLEIKQDEQMPDH